MKQKSFTALAIYAALLTGCASGSHVITGQAREPVESTEVKVYHTPPAQKHEVIGRVEASSTQGVTQQGRMDSAVETLKQEAAELGANGVIVDAPSRRGGGVSTNISTGVSGGSSGLRTGLGTGFTINPASVYGSAIYVYPNTAKDTSNTSAAQ